MSSTITRTAIPIAQYRNMSKEQQRNCSARGKDAGGGRDRGVAGRQLRREIGDVGPSKAMSPRPRIRGFLVGEGKSRMAGPPSSVCWFLARKQKRHHRHVFGSR